MNPVDASMYFWSRTGSSTDVLVTIAFGSGNAPSPVRDDIVRFIESRASVLDPINVRVVEIPGDLGFPQLKIDRSPLSSHVVEKDLGSSGPDAWRRYVEELTQCRVDARHQAWTMHIVRNVSDVPGYDGIATIMILQASHAVIDGQGAAKLVRDLFAAKSTSAALQQNFRRRDIPVPLSVASAVVRNPVDWLRWQWSGTRALRRYRRALRDGSVREPVITAPDTYINASADNSRMIYVLPIPRSALKDAGTTVTVAGLAAVSAALGGFLAQHHDPSPTPIIAMVPVAVSTDEKWVGRNRTVPAYVDLSMDIEDLGERRRAVEHSLAQELSRLRDPRLLNVMRAQSKIPAWIGLRATRQQQRSGSKHLAFNILVTSVDRGPADLELCGFRSVMSVGFPPLAPHQAVNHGFYGFGDRVFLCVVVCPSVMPDHDDYIERLNTAIDSLPQTPQSVDEDAGLVR